jgi:hypothetical protein
VKSDNICPSATATSRCCGRLSRSNESGFGEIGGMGKTSGLANHDANTCATVATRGQFLDTTIVKNRGGIAAVFGKYFSEFSARAHCDTENFFEHRLFDHLFLLRSWATEVSAEASPAKRRSVSAPTLI